MAAAKKTGRAAARFVKILNNPTQNGTLRAIQDKEGMDQGRSVLLACFAAGVALAG